METHPAVGMTFGMFSAGSPLVLPGDQRPEEAYSAVFTSPVLEEPLEILGRPRVTFQATTDAEVTTFAARPLASSPSTARRRMFTNSPGESSAGSTG